MDLSFTKSPGGVVLYVLCVWLCTCMFFCFCLFFYSPTRGRSPFLSCVSDCLFLCFFLFLFVFHTLTRGRNYFLFCVPDCLFVCVFCLFLSLFVNFFAPMSSLPLFLKDRVQIFLYGRKRSTLKCVAIIFFYNVYFLIKLVRISIKICFYVNPLRTTLFLYRKDSGRGPKNFKKVSKTKRNVR